MGKQIMAMRNIVLTVLLLALATPALGATPSNVGLLETALSGVKAEGYGPFSWGDAPAELPGIECELLQEDFPRDNLARRATTTCEATAKLPDFAGIPVKKARFFFDFDRYSGVMLVLDTTGQESGLARFESTDGEARLIFSRDKNSNIAYVTLGRVDLDDTAGAAGLAKQQAGNDQEPSMALFMEKMREVAPQAAEVLDDYATVLGRPLTIDAAHQFIVSSPAFKYLLGAKILVSNKAEGIDPHAYDIALDTFKAAQQQLREIGHTLSITREGQ